MKLTNEMKQMRKNGLSYAKIAEKYGVAKSTMQEAFGVRKRDGKLPDTKPEVDNTKNIGRSLSEFRKTYDKNLIIPGKIKEALSKIKNAWLYENEFVKLAGISFTDLGNFRDMFADHVVSLNRSSKRVWAGSISLANQLKEIV